MEFYLSHHQPLVVAKKLVNFKGMLTTLDEPAHFIDDAWLSEQEELFTVSERNFVFIFLS